MSDRIQVMIIVIVVVIVSILAILLALNQRTLKGGAFIVSEPDDVLMFTLYETKNINGHDIRLERLSHNIAVFSVDGRPYEIGYGSSVNHGGVRVEFMKMSLDDKWASVRIEPVAGAGEQQQEIPDEPPEEQEEQGEDPPEQPPDEPPVDPGDEEDEEEEEQPPEIPPEQPPVNESPEDPPEQPPTEECREVKFGTMFDASYFRNDENFRNEFLNYFYSGFLAGSPNFWFTQPEQGVYSFAALDYMVDFLENEGKEYGLYHNILLHVPEKWPQWYVDLSQEERRAALEAHTRTVVSNFEGRIPIYNVANHPMLKPWNDPGFGYMGTGWSREELIANALNWAHEEDPNAILIINEGGDTSLDRGIQINTTVSQMFVDMVEEIIERGGHLDAIGVMGHHGIITGELIPTEILDASWEILETLELPIYITEFDVSYDWTSEYLDGIFDPEAVFVTDDGTSYDNYWEYQAWAQRAGIEYYLSKPSVVGIYMWGVVDSPQSWREGINIYDYDMSVSPPVLYKKPAYYAIEDYLIEAKNNQGILTVCE